MVQKLAEGFTEDSEELHGQLKVVPLSGVHLNDDAARLKSRGDNGQDNIFEIQPRFSITGEESESWECQYVKRKQEVLAVTSGGDITGIAVGADLVALDKEKDELCKQMHFSAPVDFIVWRRSILLIGLSSSEIILVDPSSYTVKCSWKPKDTVEVDQRYYVEAFIHSTPDPTKIDVMIVAVNGSVFTMRDVSLSDGTLDATHDQNVSLDIDLGTMKNVSEMELHISSKIVSVSSPSRNKLIVLEKCGRVVVVDLNEDNDEGNYPKIPSCDFSNCIFSCLSRKLIKCGVYPQKVTAFDGKVFILLSNGVLDILYGNNFFSVGCLKLPSSSATVYDFQLVQNNNECTVKLWVLYGSSTENYVGIFNGPDFIQEFSFQLPSMEKEGRSHFKFPRNVSPFEEPTTILELASSAVRIHNIVETSTDVTLQKLLSRGKYAEAHELAVNYNKNLDIVRKAEARDKLGKITLHLSEGKLSVAELEYTELLNILGSISDAEFICQFCVQVQIYKVEWVKEILILGKGRISECPNSPGAKTLLLTFKKFYTFELVYPAGTISEWNMFVSNDNTMLMQCMKFLQNTNYDKCERVWRRHSEEFIAHITLAEFLPFFNVLFDHQLKTPESISLLKTILPFAIEKVAKSISLDVQRYRFITKEDIETADIPQLNALINIILRQVSTLEGKIEWPANALHFVQILNSIIKDEIRRLDTSRTELPASLLPKKAIVAKLKCKLDHIEQVLGELGELKRNHSIRILFSEYTQNQIPEVVNKLLYRLLSKEEVEGFVLKYLLPYAERKQLDVDSLFSGHINSVLENIHYYIQAINIPHEERIVCLVNLISSAESKLTCVLRIAEEWPVPWTPGIDNMVKHILDTFSRNSLNSTCIKLYDHIGVMRKQVPYRCVVNKYKLNGAKLLVSSCYLSMALIRILKLRKPGYYSDCKELLKNVCGGRVLDEARLGYLEFVIRMYDKEISEEDVLGDTAILNLPGLKKAMIHRVELELKRVDNDEIDHLYSLEERERLIKIYNYLAAETSNPAKIVLARLLQFLPSISVDIIYHDEFPFSVLTNLSEAIEGFETDPRSVIDGCKKLCQITKAYLPDMLIAVALFFLQQGHSEAIVWNIVEHIVQTPLDLNIGNNPGSEELLQTASFEIASTLVLQCPKLSLEQMETLHEFLCLISITFNHVCDNIAQLLCFYRIFWSLKEQEIPLENEFMEIYRWVAGEPRSWPIIKSKFCFIGETLIKFGETDMFFSIFKSLRRHIVAHLPSIEDPAGINYYQKVILEIDKIKDDLWARVPNSSADEDAGKLETLVKDLNAAGIRVNTYALKLRNKVKLLERLLKLQNYIVAADLAIAFDIYDVHVIWSKILSGCCTSCGSPESVDELQRILETVRTVPELWTLPEFAKAWKKVSETVTNFLDLCPIPLD